MVYNLRSQTLGPLILLLLTVAAILWHSIGDLHKTPKVSDLKSQVSDMVFPEQKFLLVGPMNINKATVEELEAVPRIGPSLAQKIVEFVKQRKRINNLEELLEVKGVGPRILKGIEPYLTCGPNT